jgi:carboxymethylenebutenolidase
MIDMESNTTLVQCYPAHEAYPDGEGPFPPVLVLHDKFGLTPSVRGAATRLARQGFYTLTPNLYSVCASFVDVAPDFMRAAGPSHLEYDDEVSAESFAFGLTDERADAVVSQAIAYIAGRSHARNGGIGVLGFSMGGRLAVLAAANHADEVRACVAFTPEGLASSSHRKPAALEAAAPIRSPLLLFFGGQDDEVPPAERAEIRGRLTELGKEFRMELFPRASHDFSCSERQTYRVGAAKQAWGQTVDLFRRILSS